MKENVRRIILIPLGVLIILTMTSCGVSKRSSIQVFEKEKIIVEDLSEEKKEVMRQEIIAGLKQGAVRYTLNAGDSLEVMYHIDLIKLKNPYLIGVQDEVNVEFHYHPGLNRTVIVRPDGMITLPIKGDFDIGGVTPKRAAEIISKGYSDIIQEPVVTVAVNKFSSKIFALQKAITNSPRGQAKQMLVSPDGYIYLPLLDGIRASGKTVDVVESEIQEKYNSEFKNLEVSLLLESIAGKQIFIFGQVKNPGKLQESHPLTVAQAVAQAGGVNNEGSIEHVKVLMISEDNTPVMRTVNLKKVLDEGRFEEDVVLPDNSIVYIPRTDAAKVGKWVDEYIRRILTWNGINYSINYEVNQ